MGLRRFLNIPERVQIESEDAGFIIVDATPSQTHALSAQISSNQIENGSDISDNYRRNPNKLQLECIVSDVSPNFKTSVTNIVSSSGSKIGGSLGNKVGNLGGAVGSVGVGVLASDLLTNGDNKVKDTLQKLETFMNRASVLKIKTKLKTYENMMIESVSIPVTADLDRAIKFTISLREVLVVNSAEGEIPERTVNGNSSHSATKPADLGKQKLREATETKQGRASSILFKIKDAAKGIFN